MDSIRKRVLQFVRSAARKNAKGEVPVGSLRLADVRRLSPFTRDYGYGRGGPVDRYYIEKYLAERQNDIRGRVLEIKSNDYTKRFGGTRVTQSDILDIDPQNPAANIIADLTQAENIPSSTYDCVVLTQVLQLIYDVRAAIRTVHRILKPGGVVLLTVPGITQIAYERLGTTWYWSFAEASMKRLLGEFFAPTDTTIELHGNVLSAMAFLYGLGQSELTKQEYEYSDPDYQLIIAVRAAKQRSRGDGGQVSEHTGVGHAQC
jgi:SAM-dependent methyltransferase